MTPLPRGGGARPPVPAPAPGPIPIAFTLNGTPVTVRVEPHERLLDLLRYRLRLPGTKEGCGEGECGSCTVWIDGLPANACLIPAWQARGCRVDTVESLDPGALEPFLAGGATQCGACTPGVVLTATWVLRNPGLLESHGLRELMAGNLCRCTGYDGIVDSLAAALREAGVEPPARDGAFRPEPHRAGPPGPEPHRAGPPGLEPHGPGPTPPEPRQPEPAHPPDPTVGGSTRP